MAWAPRDAAAKLQLPGALAGADGVTASYALLTRMFRGYSMPDPYAMPMFMLVGTLLSAGLAAASPAGTMAWSPHEGQDHGRVAAVQRRQLGTNLPVREIERRVIPRMPGAQYLGFDYDPGTEVYTLKFLRNGSVIWVDVDGRDGRIIRRTGS